MFGIENEKSTPNCQLFLNIVVYLEQKKKPNNSIQSYFWNQDHVHKSYHLPLEKKIAKHTKVKAYFSLVVVECCHFNITMYVECTLCSSHSSESHVYICSYNF